MWVFYLVRERYEHGEQVQVKIHVVAGLDELVCFGGESVGNIGEYRHYDSKVVTVRFDKVVASDRRRVDVMLAEVSKQILHKKKREETNDETCGYSKARLGDKCLLFR